MKLTFTVILLVLKGSLVNACTCAKQPETIEEIYNDSDGIYYVVVTAIKIIDELNKNNSLSSVKLDVDLKIMHTFKGKEIGILKAIAYGRIPYIDRNGSLGLSKGSCDFDIGFGDTYIISKFGNGEIKLTFCSDNILNESDWKQFEKLQKLEKKKIKL